MCASLACICRTRRPSGSVGCCAAHEGVYRSKHCPYDYMMFERCEFKEQNPMCKGVIKRRKKEKRRRI